MARQEWQDTVLADVCSYGANGGESPWIIFTAGGMGVGKGYVLRWLADHGLFALDRVVYVDPDHFKSVLPEWGGYVRANAETAGRLCHCESIYLAEIAQEVALRQGRHLLIDGSLRDSVWYAKVIERLRHRFPTTLRIGILHVAASRETVRARVAERAARTGRDVPEELWQASLDQVRRTLMAPPSISPASPCISLGSPLPRLPGCSVAPTTREQPRSTMVDASAAGGAARRRRAKVGPSHADLRLGRITRGSEW